MGHQGHQARRRHQLQVGVGTDGRWGGSTNGRLGSVAGSGPSVVARISQLNQLKSGLEIAPHLDVFLSVKDLIRMARIVTPLNVTVNVMEVIEMPTNITTKLVDLLVGVRLA